MRVRAELRKSVHDQEGEGSHSLSKRPRCTRLCSTLVGDLGEVLSGRCEPSATRVYTESRHRDEAAREKKYDDQRYPNRCALSRIHTNGASRAQTSALAKYYADTVSHLSSLWTLRARVL